MKKTASVFLAFLFVIYLIGIQLVYWVELRESRTQASDLAHSRNLKKENKQVIVLNQKQYNVLEWSDTGKEFSLNNSRYDVLDIKFISGKVEITCYADARESKLVLAFNEFMDKFVNGHQKSQGSKKSGNILQKEYLPLALRIVHSDSGQRLPALINEQSQPVSGPSFGFWNPPRFS